MAAEVQGGGGYPRGLPSELGGELRGFETRAARRQARENDLSGADRGGFVTVSHLPRFARRVLRLAAVAGAFVVISSNSAAFTLMAIAVVLAVSTVLLLVLVTVLSRGARHHAALAVLSAVLGDLTRASAGRRRAHQEPSRRPVHRSVVVVDVEGFGDERRTNWHQVAVRDGLYRAMQEAFNHAGIPWGACDHEDRGDGVFVLVPPDVPKELLVESLPPALVTALDRHNSTHKAPEQIRLRMALHAGEISYDEHGTTAAALNMAFRLSDVDALKAALASSPGVLAVIASSWFFQEVVRHNPACNADAYRRVRVRSRKPPRSDGSTFQITATSHARTSNSVGSSVGCSAW